MTPDKSIGDCEFIWKDGLENPDKKYLSIKIIIFNLLFISL